MKQLSLDALRALVSIIELGSFHKAGELIGRTQPTISLQIKKLETQLNKKLFNKVGQKYQANKDGQWLYEQAKTMLSINDQIVNHFEQTNIKGRLRLGIPSEFATAFLPGIIGEFNHRYPDVSLEVTSSLSRHLLNKQQRSNFDLILALQHPNSQPDGELLLEDQLVWVGKRNHSINKRHLSLVLAPDGCMYRSEAINVLKQQTIEWRIAYTNADLYGLIAAMNQNLGITVLAKSSVPSELEIIKSRHLPKLGKINISLIKQGDQAIEACKTLSRFIRDRIK